MRATSRFAVLAAVLAAGLAAVALVAAGPGAPAPPPQLAYAGETALAAVSGPPLHVSCRVLSGGYIDVMGHSDRGRRLIELNGTICRRLNRLVVGASPVGSAAFLQEGEALLVGVHEAVHLSPYGRRADEALVECRAVQLVAETAQRIGLDPARAAALGHAALRAHDALPGAGDWRVGLGEEPSYQAPGCYDGGPLDIHPESTDWPN